MPFPAKIPKRMKIECGGGEFMKKIIKRIIGILIMLGLFLLWFIPQVIEYGLLVSSIALLIMLLLIFLFFLAVFLIFGD